MNVRVKKPKKMGRKATNVGLIDLLPFRVAENIRDNEAYGDALSGMLGGDYDPNSYQKALKRAAIREFRKRRGAK